MHSFMFLLFVLSVGLTLASGASVPAKVPLRRRTTRTQIPHTLREPALRRDLTTPGDKRNELFERQAACGAGYVTCSAGGCCTGACCGDGCCPSGYACHYVGSQPGCCPIGQTCSDTISGCTVPGEVQCTNYDFCCPSGQFCYIDSTCASACASGSPGHFNGCPISSSTVNSVAPSVHTAVQTTTVVTPPSNPTYTPNPNASGGASINSIGTSTTTMAVLTTAGQVKPDLVSPTKEGSSGGNQRSGPERRTMGVGFGITVTTTAALCVVSFIVW